jgi:excisionase family DNA binding protein
MPTTATVNMTRTFWRRTVAIGHGGAKDDRTQYLFTIAEACTALRISRWTLYRLIRSRQLATIKLRSRRFVPRDALHALIEHLSNEDAL